MKHHAPIQCVFLILTYLQYNRRSEHTLSARYYVDRVLDIYMPDAQSRHAETNFQALGETGGMAHVKPKSFIWTMLLDLRQKLDLPCDTAQPILKPTVPIRCQTVPSAIALHTRSLAKGDKSSPNTAQDPSQGPSYSDFVDTSVDESFLNSNPPLTGDSQYQDPATRLDIAQLLDFSELDSWSSTLVPESTDGFR